MPLRMQEKQKTGNEVRINIRVFKDILTGEKQLGYLINRGSDCSYGYLTNDYNFTSSLELLSTIVKNPKNDMILTMIDWIQENQFVEINGLPYRWAKIKHIMEGYAIDV